MTSDDNPNLIEKVERSTQEGEENPEFRNSLMYLNRAGPQFELSLGHTLAVISQFEKASAIKRVLLNNLRAFELAKYMANSIDGRTLNVFTTKRAILEQRSREPVDQAGGGNFLSNMLGGNKGKQQQPGGGGMGF